MEPRYEGAVAEWLDSLEDRNPDLLDRIEDHIDLLREEPIPSQAYQRQFRAAAGKWLYFISFGAQGQTWTILWAKSPEGRAVVSAIVPDLPL